MSQAAPENKGRPTPKRKDAEAKRVVNSLAPAKNRAERSQQKVQLREQRALTRAAYMRGEEGALPARDRGPVRRFIRDTVDARRSVGEYFLPMLFVVLVVSRLPKLQVVAVLLMYFIMLSAIVDWFLLTRRIKREISTRFPETPIKGLGMYAWTRSTQLRRLRAPKPQKSPGKKNP
jgi:Flp pilus assembly protein TadB